MQSFRPGLAALYIPNLPAEGGSLSLPTEEERHARALRLRPGEGVILLDGEGRRAEGIVERIDRRGIVVHAGPTVLDGEEGRTYIALGIGILSDKSRFEWIVEKGVELGVREIVPLATERAEGRLHIDRLQRIAIAALKQSQRSFLPSIAEATPFATMVERFGEFDHVYFCHESAPVEESLARALIDSVGAGRIAILIGPEGGFAEREVEIAREASASVVSLGDVRLRAETAALMAVSLIAGLSGVRFDRGEA